MKITAQLVVRIDPKLKRDVARAAKRQDTSIQKYVSAALLDRLACEKQAEQPAGDRS